MIPHTPTSLEKKTGKDGALINIRSYFVVPYFWLIFNLCCQKQCPYSLISYTFIGRNYKGTTNFGLYDINVTSVTIGVLGQTITT